MPGDLESFEKELMPGYECVPKLSLETPAYLVMSGMYTYHQLEKKLRGQ